MKNLLIIVLLGTLFASCGRVESPDQLFDFLDTQKQVDNNSDDINELQKRLDTLYNSLDVLSSQVGDINVNQDNLTQIVNSTVTSIATLESNNTVKEVIDPCGDNSGQFDEVLLVMSDGSIIAYFESGSTRYLTVLGDGNYRTTDKQSCSFSVVNGKYQE